MEYNLISKIVTSVRLLYLADEAIKHMCWRVGYSPILLKNIETKGDFYNGKE